MNRNSESGFALMAVLLLVALLASISLSFFLLTRMETRSVRANSDSVRGFYAAEGGINFRVEKIRTKFVDFQLPTGTPPNATNACAPGNLGSGDFACEIHSFDGRSVSTYVVDDPTSPRSIVIPRGEPFQNLNAAVYDYDLRSVAINDDGAVEAQIDMAIETRLVPLFQFMIFFDKDLEVTPGPAMALNGPIHTNGDLYAAAATSVDVSGQVTAAGDIYRGRKEGDICWTGPFRVTDPVNPVELPTCSGGRRLITNSDVAAWNGNVASGADVVTVPAPEALEAAPGRTYWDNADLRVMYDVDAGTVQVRNPDGSNDATRTAALAACGSATTSNSFYNHREATTIRMLDVDVRDLLDCADAQNLLIGGRALDDTTHGGLVLYFGVTGADVATVNDYGVRFRNADVLESTNGLAPVPVGVTMITNQAAYTQGDYNETNKKPAAIMADSINVLSEAWPNADYPQATGVSSRVATETTVNAAFLAGTDSTGGGDGAAFQDLGDYSGGVHNMPRHHENWTGVAFNYLGSLVSLNVAQHVDGALVVGSPQYNPPIRNYAFDTDFNDPSNLPPITPRFVYAKQAMYVRDFEQ